jgi:hypothetical protein
MSVPAALQVECLPLLTSGQSVVFIEFDCETGPLSCLRTSKKPIDGPCKSCPYCVTGENAKEY